MEGQGADGHVSDDVLCLFYVYLLCDPLAVL